jgi:hypothetical protein
MHFSGARPVGGLVQDNFDDLQAVIAPDWLPLLVTPEFSLAYLWPLDPVGRRRHGPH